jgi:hypothetical protein
MIYASHNRHSDDKFESMPELQGNKDLHTLNIVSDATRSHSHSFPSVAPSTEQVIAHPVDRRYTRGSRENGPLAETVRSVIDIYPANVDLRAEHTGPECMMKSLLGYCIAI